MYPRIISVPLTIAFAVACAGCSLIAPTHYVTHSSVTYDPSNSARVRILSDNGNSGAVFWTGRTCQPGSWRAPDRTGVVVTEDLATRWKNASYSIVIGMPASPRIWMRTETLERKDFIKEYVVPAGQPMTIAMSTGTDPDISYSCRNFAGTFTPQAGGDYDVYGKSAGRRDCVVAVQRISAAGDDTAIPVQKAYSCE